jgi:hypothetical protein
MLHKDYDGKDSVEKKMLGELWFKGLTLKTPWQAVENM